MMFKIVLKPKNLTLGIALFITFMLITNSSGAELSDQYYSERLNKSDLYTWKISELKLESSLGKLFINQKLGEFFAGKNESDFVRMVVLHELGNINQSEMQFSDLFGVLDGNHVIVEKKLVDILVKPIQVKLTNGSIVNYFEYLNSEGAETEKIENDKYTYRGKYNWGSLNKSEDWSNFSYIETGEWDVETGLMLSTNITTNQGDQILLERKITLYDFRGFIFENLLIYTVIVVLSVLTIIGIIILIIYRFLTKKQKKDDKLFPSNS